MSLSEIIKLESCTVDLQAKDKDDTLKQIAKLLRRSSELTAIDDTIIYKALKEREEMGSTGFSKGIAMPHCQLEGIENFVISLAICKKGIYFDSLDKKKSKIFVTIIGPKGDRNRHLKLLASCSHILKEPGVINDLLQTNTKINLYEEFLRNADNGVGGISQKGQEKLMILIVKDENIIQDITEVFIEYGVEQSTIIDTQQMENLLSKVPLFMGFFNFTGDKNPASKIILVKITKDHINAIVKGLEDIFGDLDYFSDLGIMVLDLSFSKGF
ncbi:MAG: PTS sugar transporter subunit IIA [Candidatus Cloacimonetes bacterium]|nr:PTS sugar transporter subunit IIA [Candidatus Cloacimonadota bacterium]MCF7815216.1 PTS sugar transporter subunit IIA [Candidatus Cloacimonadota bacterium]MCF7869386.1 PTS sugar transporter subunit IIA [Candidatus Cloacimonadota bacterium]